MNNNSHTEQELQKLMQSQDIGQAQGFTQRQDDNVLGQGAIDLESASMRGQQLNMPDGAGMQGMGGMGMNGSDQSRMVQQMVNNIFEQSQQQIYQMMTKGGRDSFNPMNSGQPTYNPDFAYNSGTGLAETSQINDHRNELKQMLLNPNQEIYIKGDDPIYETFRQTIRDRESFNNNVINLKLNDNIRLWRTRKDIEADCKEQCRKCELKHKKKKERIEKYIYCGCLRGRRKLGWAAKKFQWMKDRTKRILKQKKSDNGFIRMGQMQGFQGEPVNYTLRKPKTFHDKFHFFLFICLVIIGGLFILNVMVPNEWDLLVRDFNNLGSFFAAIPGALWIGVKAIVDVPNKVVDHLEHAAMKQFAKGSQRHSQAQAGQTVQTNLFAERGWTAT